MIEISIVIGSWLICIIAAERAAEALTTSAFFSPMRQGIATIALMDLYKSINTGTNIENNQSVVVYRGTIYAITKKIARWVSDLISCGWCTSFWTSSFFSIFLPGEYWSTDACNNIIVKSIALWGFANLWHSVFRLIHNGRVSAIDMNLRIIDDLDSGGTDGEFGEGESQENTIRLESTEI
jgi:hypothetical protein